MAFQDFELPLWYCFFVNKIFQWGRNFKQSIGGEMEIV